MTRKHVGVVGSKGGAGVFQRVISWIPLSMLAAVADFEWAKTPECVTL